MRHIFRIVILSVLLVMQSCEKNELKNAADLTGNFPKNIESPSELNAKASEHHCATVSQFGPNSYWANTIVNQTETNFLKTHHNGSADFFGLGNVPLYFAAGDGTFNALSYRNGYVIWGEQILEHALGFGRAAVAYVAAHEIAHQVQFRYRFPSVSGASNTELEADGFAGYYLRKKYSTNWSNVSSAYNMAQSIGGSNGSSHGTPAQRRSALRLGWLLSESNLSNNDFDRYFFYYYQRYVIPGAWRLGNQPQKPKDFNKEIHDFILTKVEELNDINTGKLSAEDFTNLK